MPGDRSSQDPSVLKAGIEDLLEHDRSQTDESLERERRVTDSAAGVTAEHGADDVIGHARKTIDDRIEEARQRGDERVGDTNAVLPEVAETLEHAAASLADVADDLAEATRGVQRTPAPPEPPAQAAETLNEVASTLVDVADRVAEERHSVDASLHEERALLDEVLETERTASDTTIEFERRVRRLMLEIERRRTDRHLDDERLDTDAAVQHALTILMDEQAGRVDAEQRAMTRDEFLAIVSHDLRSPLDAIAINAALIAENAPDDEKGAKYQKWARNIQRGVDTMARLVSDLLDVARFEGGDFRVMPQTDDATTIVKEAAETFTPVATARELHLEVTVPPEPVLASFDHGRMLQVLSNLLRNAIHFTPSGGFIRVTLTREAHGCRIAVTDTGIGIPRAEQARIFDRFQQLRSADRRGLGLGLYISKCIIDAHGGHIWVESNPGKGSTFSFTLPAP